MSLDLDGKDRDDKDVVYGLMTRLYFLWTLYDLKIISEDEMCEVRDEV
jgi:hypothetical protein